MPRFRVKVFVEGVDCGHAGEAEAVVREELEACDLSGWKVFVVAEDEPMNPDEWEEE